jgi:eukaryotic-like serine/threonine-protein kinase
MGADQRFHAPLTGVRLGRYLLGDRLGAGGAASVYLAQLRGPHDFERLLAVKVVHEHLTESSDFVNMFLDEANLAVRLAHPCIVHSYELGRDGPYLFLAMEYLSGQPLSKLMGRAKSLGQRLDPRMVAWIGARSAEGLAYAHALTDEAGKRVSLVHRDVSPQNLFLTYDGHVKVIDFGIAHAEGRLTHTGLGRIKGKFSYMAPEQMLKQTVDHRADLFALGATLYEAAVGERPFQAEDEAEAIAMLLEETAPKPEERVPGFPERLSQILCRALEREPEDRYAGAAEMARDLDEYVRATGVPGVEAELAQVMTSSFVTERDEQARAISKLRSLDAGTVREPIGSTTTADRPPTRWPRAYGRRLARRGESGRS